MKRREKGRMTGTSNLKPLRLRIAYYDEYSNIIRIEEDLGGIFRAYANLLASRYAEIPRTDFMSKQDLEDKRIGVIGQKMFESLLVQHMIPFIPVDPGWKFKIHRPFCWDFLIPGFGTIEVKSFPKHDRFFVVKAELWDCEVSTAGPPNFAIALRLMTDSEAKMEGWIEGEKVASLSHNPKVCPYKRCYCCRFEELHSFEKLLPKLMACSLKKQSMEGGSHV